MVTYTYQVLYTTGLGPYLLRKELLKQAMLRAQSEKAGGRVCLPLRSGIRPR